MKRFQGRYRTDTVRLQSHDYRAPGWYFITICTHRRQPFFGTIRNGIMGLSQAGCIAAQEWLRTAAVRPYVRLDRWIVMPNHIHGLLGITTETPVETSRRDVTGGTTAKRTPRLQAHSVGAIIGQYKSVCTKRIRRGIRPDFAWQARFYDHVVRNRRSFDRIRRYIASNPQRWDADRNRENRSATG